MTELMEAGSTLRIAWTPTRAGNWLMHCHLLDHVTPFPERKPEERVHDLHDVEKHPVTAMAGLVLGITVSEDSGPAKEPKPDHRLRLIARELRSHGSDVVRRGFVVEDGSGSSGDRPSVPGTTTIEVMNEMSEATTVHWHGMELESVYDGVAGWSRTGPRIAPLVGPGSSFRVQMTPPRAGTFIYHTHMDETEQLIGGLYGPLIVLEPGEAFEPDRDRIYVVGGASHDGEYQHVTINGRLEPMPEAVRTGVAYRLRFINITPDATVALQFRQNGALQMWKAITKDGADLPAALRVERPASLRFGPGETYDFEWTPESPGEATLGLEWEFPTEHGSLVLRQPIVVRSD